MFKVGKLKQKAGKLSTINISMIITFVVIFFSQALLLTNLNIDLNEKSINFEPQTDYEYSLMSSNGDPILFQGTESSVNITDYGNLYELNQEVSLTNEKELNLTYYLDDSHEWKISEIQNAISNIQDTRDWNNNSEILPVNIFRKNSTPPIDTNGYSNNHGIS